MNFLTRYPFADVAPFIEAEWRPLDEVRHRTHIGIVGIAAEALGVSVRTVHHWRVRGLNEQQADHIACRLGYHPSLIWPEWWDGAT
jgi:hypothetical protein